MKHKDNGGPAFPTLQAVGNVALSEGGLTVRDYFAAAAMQGILSIGGVRSIGQDSDSENTKLAIVSYSVADAMLEARKL